MNNKYGSISHYLSSVLDIVESFACIQRHFGHLLQSSNISCPSAYQSSAVLNSSHSEQIRTLLPATWWWTSIENKCLSPERQRGLNSPTRDEYSGAWAHRAIEHVNVHRSVPWCFSKSKQPVYQFRVEQGTKLNSIASNIQNGRNVGLWTNWKCGGDGIISWS